MEIGFETNKGSQANPSISNIVFNNITVLHALHKSTISIHNGDDAAITATFKNIIVENFQTTEWPYIIDFTNMKGGTTGFPGTAASWSTVKDRYGSINATVENVQVLDGKTPRGRFKGDGGTITGTVKNVTFKGQKLEFTNEANSNVSFP
jgi:hypothetical protein